MTVTTSSLHVPNSLPALKGWVVSVKLSSLSITCWRNVQFLRLYLGCWGLRDLIRGAHPSYNQIGQIRLSSVASEEKEEVFAKLGLVEEPLTFPRNCKTLKGDDTLLERRELSLSVLWLQIFIKQVLIQFIYTHRLSKESGWIQTRSPSLK